MTSGDGKGQQAVARVGRILHPGMGRVADMNRMMRWRVLVVLIVLAPALLVTSSQGQAPRKGVMVVDFEDVGRGWSYTRELVTAPRSSPRRRRAPCRGSKCRRPCAKPDWRRPATSIGRPPRRSPKPSKSITSSWVRGPSLTSRTRGGKVPDVAAGTFVIEPRSEVKKTQTSVSIWIGPWWTDVTVNNFDGQLIGRATQEAVEDFIGKLKPSRK